MLQVKWMLLIDKSASLLCTIIRLLFCEYWQHDEQRFQITDKYISNRYVYIRTKNILKMDEAQKYTSLKRSI